MNLKNQIREYRVNLGLSQDELAEKAYVTRQSISNWENGKNYPDINSILLLSEIFNISVDELLKGDLKAIKESIDKETLSKFKMLGNLLTIGFILVIISAAPLLLLWGLKGSIIWGIIFIITMIIAAWVDRIKKKEDIHTYKEIVDFMEGKRLEGNIKEVEKGKRIYQKTILVLIFGIGSAVITFLVATLMEFLGFI